MIQNQCFQLLEEMNMPAMCIERRSLEGKRNNLNRNYFPSASSKLKVLLFTHETTEMKIRGNLIQKRSKNVREEKANKGPSKTEILKVPPVSIVLFAQVSKIKLSKSCITSVTLGVKIFLARH